MNLQSSSHGVRAAAGTGQRLMTVQKIDALFVCTQANFRYFTDT